MKVSSQIAAPLSALAAALLALGVQAQGVERSPSQGVDQDRTADRSDHQYRDSDDERYVVDRSDDAPSREAADAQEQIDESVKLVEQMKSDPDLARALAQAKGVFLMPDYGQAGLIIGGEGGEGVVLLRESSTPGSEWSAPAFFNFGGATFGAEAGVEAGQIAMLLMTDEAVQQFKSGESNFSLDASAGLTVVNWSAKAEASVGKGDVILWSDSEGAFAGAAIGISNIHSDKDENAAYYGEGMHAQDILSSDRKPQGTQPLLSMLPS